MRNRNTINKQLEVLENTLINLQRIVNTQEPINVYKENIEKCHDLVGEIKSMIEREPFAPGE